MSDSIQQTTPSSPWRYDHIPPLKQSTNPLRTIRHWLLRAIALVGLLAIAGCGSNAVTPPTGYNGGSGVGSGEPLLTFTSDDARQHNYSPSVIVQAPWSIAWVCDPTLNVNAEITTAPDEGNWVVQCANSPGVALDDQYSGDIQIGMMAQGAWSLAIYKGSDGGAAISTPAPTPTPLPHITLFTFTGTGTANPGPSFTTTTPWAPFLTCDSGCTALAGVDFTLTIMQNGHEVPDNPDESVYDPTQGHFIAGHIQDPGTYHIDIFGVYPDDESASWTIYIVQQ